MNKAYRLYIVLVMLALLAISNMPVAAQEQVEDGPKRDAEWYASHYGVQVEEALRRLQLQIPAGDLDGILAEKEKNTFAGLWIQHRPDFRVIVQFTTRGMETIRPYIANGPLASIVDIRTVSVPVTQLSSARNAATQLVTQLGVSADVATNIMANRAEIYVTDRAQFDTAFRQAKLPLPANVAVVNVNTLMKPQANIFGGLALDSGSIRPYCTTGFSVKNSGGTKYITTAGHCSNAMTYLGVSLSRAGQAYSGSYDLQWLNPAGFTPVNLVKASSTTSRTITGSKSRNSQAIGEVVCKYGAVTTYTCGQILQKDYRPSYVPSASATFIRVESTQRPISLGGDSGAPWFNGNTAFGIHSGGDGNYTAIYMPIDFINGQGLTLLTN